MVYMNDNIECLKQVRDMCDDATERCHGKDQMLYINDNIECLKQEIEQCDDCDEQYQHISHLYDMGIKKYSGTAHKTEVWTFWI